MGGNTVANRTPILKATLHTRTSPVSSKMIRYSPVNPRVVVLPPSRTLRNGAKSRGRGRSGSRISPGFPASSGSQSFRRSTSNMGTESPPIPLRAHRSLRSAHNTNGLPYRIHNGIRAPHRPRSNRDPRLGITAGSRNPPLATQKPPGRRGGEPPALLIPLRQKGPHHFPITSTLGPHRLSRTPRPTTPQSCSARNGNRVLEKALVKLNAQYAPPASPLAALGAAPPMSSRSFNV